MMMMMEWQDISTAPKDGTMILAVRSGFKPTTVKWVDFDGYARFCEDPETFMNQDHFEQYFMGTDYAPDYWMPLPAPKEPL